MNIHIDVGNITLGQRRRIANMIAEYVVVDMDVEITQHPEKQDWLIVEEATGQSQIDDLGCIRKINYGDWSDPA